MSNSVPAGHMSLPCFDLFTAAQYKEPTDDDIKALNQRLQWQMDSLDRGLTFVPLDLATAKLDDGQFTVRGNVIHFSTTKSKRAACSVLAPEVYGMVAGVDMAYTISTTIAIITSRLSTPAIPTIACTDSYSLYECLVNLGTTQEQRLMIDIMALRQSYARRKLCEVRWIHGNDNPADGFTKSSPNRGFERIVSRNEPKIRMEGWVTRA
ncbi:hypothetical protein LY78DRAFT_686014 [Colletotrichum sublineola]|nr:hypothetical protein LY78DRAFT_686014 [Colletotrichum sublineola]